MKRVLPLIAATAVAISLASCSAQEPEQEPQPSDSAVEKPSDQTAAQQEGQDADEEDQQGSGGDETSKDEDGSSQPDAEAAPESSKVTVAIDGQETIIEPTDVYCSGNPGSIEHIIGKTDHQPPLIKVAGNSEFAMVKLQQQGPPEKSNNPADITFGQEWVEFDDTRIGSAQVSGAMVCTQWED